MSNAITAVVEGTMPETALAEGDPGLQDVIEDEAEVAADLTLADAIEEEKRDGAIREAMTVAEMTPGVTIVTEEIKETSTMTDIVEREETLEKEMTTVGHHRGTRDMNGMTLEVAVTGRVVQEVTEMSMIKAILTSISTLIRTLITQRMSQTSSETTIMKRMAMREVFLMKKSRSMWTPKRKK